METPTNMIPIVMDTDFSRVGMLDSYSSFIWTERYYKCGDFEIECAATDKARALFVPNRYVCREGLSSVGVIEDVVLSRDKTGADSMLVSGRFLPSILARRIIAQQTTVSGKVSDCVNKIITENAITPTDSARKIPGLKLGSYSIATPMNKQWTGTGLLDAIIGVCESYGCGFDIVLDGGNNFVFTLYEGVDRSFDQTANPYVVFSEDNDNLFSSDYEEDYSTIATDVLVAGEGDGLDRKMTWARRSSNSGLARREVFKDARNASSNNGAISNAVYLQQLRDEGLQYITNYSKAFAGSVNFDTVEFRKDVNVGDVVVVQNVKWGIDTQARIVEVIESVGKNGAYTVTPTFGDYSIPESNLDTSAYIETASAVPILTARAAALVAENGSFDAANSVFDSGVKISDLTETKAPGADWWLVISSATETEKVSWRALRDAARVSVVGDAPISATYDSSGNAYAIGIALASQSADGALSHEDKIKLDGLERSESLTNSEIENLTA